jgi:uncharacterized protein YggL (DUF469 family)
MFHQNSVHFFVVKKRKKKRERRKKKKVLILPFVKYKFQVAIPQIKVE